MRHKAQVIIGITLTIFLCAAAALALVPEKDLLLNSRDLGDFRKARQTKEKDKASLKVWENYAEFQRKQLSQIKGLMLQGPGESEVAYDEIWEVERDLDPTLVVARERQGKPFRVKLYWRQGQLQAFTVEKYFKGDPLTWEKLDKSGYRIIALLDRKILLPRLEKLQAQEQAFQVMAAAAHLQEAKKALAAGHPDEKELKKRTYGRLYEARRHLEAISSDADEYDEAKKLLDEVERREKDLKKYQEAMRQAESKKMIKQREEMAKELDKDFLSKGFDLKIELGGDEKTVLNMDCVLFSRPLVFVFVDKSDLLPRLREAGFEEVVFSNKKINYSWEIYLNN